MEEKFIRDALILWATIDPVGTLVIFAGLTSSHTSRQRQILALKAISYSGLILFSSILIGQFLLAALGIKLISLQIAGGIILLLFGLQMVFGTLTQNLSNNQEDSERNLAISPLTIPSIANPGTIMAVIILTDNQAHSILVQTGTSLILLGILLVTALLMIAAGPILRVIGSSGSTILIRVMGMILAALSVEFILDALGIPGWVAGS